MSHTTDQEQIVFIEHIVKTNKKGFARLKKNSELLEKYAWDIVHNNIADNQIKVIRDLLPYCVCHIERSIHGNKHLALQMCIDYGHYKLFEMIYTSNHAHIRTQHPTRKQKEDLLLLAWEKDAQKTNMSVEEIFAVQSVKSKNIANFLFAEMTAEQMRDLLERIEDPNLWRHVGNILEKHQDFKEDGQALLGKWHNYVNHVTHDIVNKDRRKHL